MPKHYVVTTLIQSPPNEPVEVQWYAGPSLGKAIAAAAQATADGGDPNGGDPNPGTGYRVLAVATRIEEVPVEMAEVAVEEDPESE